MYNNSLAKLHMPLIAPFCSTTVPLMFYLTNSLHKLYSLSLPGFVISIIVFVFNKSLISTNAL